MAHSNVLDRGIGYNNAPSRERAVPSAGSIYPYKVLYNPARGADAATLEVYHPGGRRDAAGSGPLYLLYEPERSMAKYGERGFLYGLQDCGHAVASLLFAGALDGLHGRFDATVDEALVGSWSEYPRMHVIGACTFAMEGAPREPGWLSLSASPDDAFPGLDAAMGSRRSASSFVDEPIPASRLELVLRTLRGSFCAAAAAEDGGLYVLAALRTRAGRWQVVDHAGGVGPSRGAREIAWDEREAVFFGQRVAGEAAAFCVVCAGAARPDARTVFAQHFLSGSLAHVLYLGAVRSGLGVTCIGGFDHALLARALRLPAGDRPVNVIALGTPGYDREKLDRRREQLLRDSGPWHRPPSAHAAATCEGN